MIGRCPDIITGIHGDEPVQLYAELSTIVDEVIDEFTEDGRALPEPSTRVAREAA